MTHTYTAFWPGTPGGYVPVLADQVIAAKRGKVDMKEAAARSRQTALSRGHTGTIKGLSAKSVAIKGDVTRAMVAKRKPVLPARRAPSGPKVTNEARTRALAAQQPKYWNDAPCHAGHVGWRYTRSYACCECMAVAAKKVVAA